MFFFFRGIFQQLHLHPSQNADRRRRWRGSWHCPRTMKCPRFGNTKTKALSWTRLEKLKHNRHSMLNGSYRPRLGNESRLYKCVLLWWRQWWWKGLWEQATWFKESLLVSARRKKESKKNLKVTFTQAYPTRRFYLCFPSTKKFNESGIILDFLPVEHPCRWHIWWYKSTLCRCLGRGQGPAERKVPWLNASFVERFCAAVGWFEASDPITFHGHPKWCQGAAGAFVW